MYQKTHRVRFVATTTITFVDDTTLSIVAGCNTIQASYTAGPETQISIELGAATLMACPDDGGYADTFLAKLGAASEINGFESNGSVILLFLTEDDSSVAFTAPE